MKNALVLRDRGHSIPVAQMRIVYRIGDVERRLDKLPPKEHEPLRATYERMLEMGPERFQVKPSGLPAFDRMYDELPNFRAAIDEVRRQLALCVDSRDPLEIAPMLLLGPPGIGKTHFAKELANLLGTGMGFASMSSMTAGWILSGASSQWKGARAGKVFEALVDGKYSNPVMVIDEIDKARGEHAYDPLGALYTLLEHDTATDFTDEFAEVPIDASQVVWIATANEARSIPEPILNRMDVHEIRPPTKEEAMGIARRVYSSIRNEHAWGEDFRDEPEEETLERLARVVPRELRRTWTAGFGNAKLRGSDRVTESDLPRPRHERRPAGFVD